MEYFNLPLLILATTTAAAMGSNYSDTYDCTAKDCYFIVNKELSHEKASTCCSRAGGHLAAVAEITDEMRLKELVKKHSWNEGVWIGAKLKPKLWHLHHSGQYLFRQGCFKNVGTETPILSGNSTTLSDCLEVCGDQEYPLASMSAHKSNRELIYQCFCNNFNDLGSWEPTKGQKSEDQCSTQCLDDPDEVCGGLRPTMRYLYAINGTRTGYWISDCQNCPKAPHNRDGDNFHPDDSSRGGPRNRDNGPPNQGRGPPNLGRSPPDRPPPGHELPKFAPGALSPDRPSTEPPKLCASLRIMFHLKKIVYFPELCGDNLDYICQYRPLRNNSCRRDDFLLLNTQICIFIAQDNGRNRDGTNLCRRQQYNAIPLEITSEEVKQGLLKIDYPFQKQFPPHKAFWSGLRKWELTWPEGSDYDITFTDWADGQPENDYTKLCVAMAGENLRWSNWDCHRPKKFICQISQPLAENLISQQKEYDCETYEPKVRAALQNLNDRKLPPMVPVGAAIGVVALAAISFTVFGICIIKRKNFNKKQETIKEVSIENRAYGTIQPREELREEVYDVLSEESMTNYASLNEVMYGAPPNDEQYKRLTTSSNHSANSGSELTKNEVNPAKEDPTEGPDLPPRDNRYTKLGDVQAKNEDGVLTETPEGNTDSTVPPTVNDNQDPKEIESSDTKDSEEEPDYLKLVG